MPIRLIQAIEVPTTFELQTSERLTLSPDLIPGTSEYQQKLEEIIAAASEQADRMAVERHAVNVDGTFGQH